MSLRVDLFGEVKRLSCVAVAKASFNGAFSRVNQTRTLVIYPWAG